MTRLRNEFLFDCTNPDCGNTDGRERDYWEGVTVCTQYVSLSTQEAITQSFHDTSTSSHSVCEVCGAKNLKVRRILSTPLILLIRFGKLSLLQVPRVVELYVQFGDDRFELMGVVYGSGSHFISRYKTASGAIYEYDGMSRSNNRDHNNARHAVCKLLVGDASTLFTGRIADGTRKFYVFYCKVV